MHKLALASRILAIVAFVAVAGCNGNSTTPGTLLLAGNYTGTINDNQSGTGTLTASFTQNGNNLSGTWNTVFGGVGVNGTVSGSIFGNQANITVSTSNCSYNVTGTLNGSSFSGGYTPNAPCTDSGTFSLVRQ